MIESTDNLAKKGEKGTRSETLLRARTIAQYIIQGHSYNDIVSQMSVRWGLAERTIKNYMNDAYELIRSDVIAQINEEKSWHIKVRLDHYRDLVKMRDAVMSNTSLSPISKTQAVVAVQKQITDLLRDMAKISGLYVDKIDVIAQVEAKTYRLPDGTIVEI